MNRLIGWTADNEPVRVYAMTNGGFEFGRRTPPRWFCQVGTKLAELGWSEEWAVERALSLCERLADE